MEGIPNLYSEPEIEAEPKQQFSKEQIDFRAKQEYGSRLAEYITGMRPEDEKMVDRLAEDQKVIRAKYHLPAIGEISLLTDYERYLRQRAEELGVEIRPTSACGDFFKEYPMAGGVSFGNEKRIGMNVVKDDADTYKRSLAILEHELIHALQAKDSPLMPIELKEYEAYIARGNMDYLRTNQRAIEAVFGLLIGSSVNMWYSSRSKQLQSEIEPEWNNADYFLNKIDKVDMEKTIE